MNMFAEERETAPNAVIGLSAEARSQFILRTYLHLLGAIILFVAAELVYFSTGIADAVFSFVTTSGSSWMLMLGGFMLVGWLATRTAQSSVSKPMQYLALIGYVLAEALLFIPLLAVAQYRVGGGVIESAALVTLVGFAALTGVVFVTRKDFSFLGAVLKWAGIVALVLIVAGLVFGFQLGTFFSVGMIAFAGAAILYDTSNILHHYPEDRYVAAALGLFASVALMFWYVLRLFMRR